MEIVEQFNYKTESKEFIQKELHTRTNEIKVYHVILWIFSLVALANVIKHLVHLDIEGIFINIFIGVVLYFVVMLFHELIHALGYVLIGGRANIKIGVGRGAFYCTCNDFEMNKKQYTLVAVLPAISLTCMSIAFMIAFPPYVLGITIFDLLHLWSSNGDVAIISFLRKHKSLYAVSHEHNKMLIFFER